MSKAFDQISRELAKRLRSLEDSVEVAKPKEIPEGERLVVTWTVRRLDGGLPFRWEYVAPKGVWKAEAEHLAKKAMRKAKLVPHAHIETSIQLRKIR